MDLHKINVSFVNGQDMEGKYQRCISEELCKYQPTFARNEARKRTFDEFRSIL